MTGIFTAIFMSLHGHFRSGTEIRTVRAHIKCTRTESAPSWQDPRGGVASEGCGRDKLGKPEGVIGQEGELRRLPSMHGQQRTTTHLACAAALTYWRVWVGLAGLVRDSCSTAASQSAAIHLPRACVRMRPTLRVLAGSASVPQRCRGDQQVVDQRTAQCNHEWHISSRAAQHRRTLHETGRWLALTMARTSSDTLPKRRLKVDRRLPRGLTHLSGSSSRYAPKRSSAAGQCEKLVPLGDRQSMRRKFAIGSIGR